MIQDIKNEIKKALKKAGVEGEIELFSPPKKEMGDLSFACFDLAKNEGRPPNEVALTIVKKFKIKNLKLKILDEVKSIGPYVNFYLNSQELADYIFNQAGEDYGRNSLGKKKKIMVEFAQPNTHKAFHIGHLRGTITGESIARILENAGYKKVIRANYQGDVGMHIAKTLWVLASQKSKVPSIRRAGKNQKSVELSERIKFLGEAYAAGSKAFEEDEQAKKEIMEINEKIYANDPDIRKLYKETRDWSLEYFDGIYKKLGTRFDRLYFESEVFKRAVEIVKEFLSKGVFEASEGAVIFAGSKHELHDRVFLNSKGLPTYEAKDLALAEKQFKEYNPEKIIHVVGKEQSEYFKVVFKAMEQVLSKSKDKEVHLPFGWVTLKHGKMSSRSGNVVLGEWLLEEINNKVNEIMEAGDLADKKEIAEKVALAAVKYSFLKTGIKNDISFDLEESVSLSGDSGSSCMYTPSGKAAKISRAISQCRPIAVRV